jgi:hypothetical protein
MRIIGKWKDYYDSAVSYGIDERLIYFRDQRHDVQVANDWPFAHEMNPLAPPIQYPDWCFARAALLFCGRFYPIWLDTYRLFQRVHPEAWTKLAEECKMSGKAPSRFTVRPFGYYQPGLVKTWNQATSADFVLLPTLIAELRQSLQGKLPDPVQQSNIRVFLGDEKPSEGFGGRNPLTVEKLEAVSGRKVGHNIFHHYRCPHLIVLQAGNHHVEPTSFCILTNPCLKDLGFAPFADSFTAFQETAMFVGGVLGRTDEAPLRVGDDEVIARQKGFDESSFRTQTPGSKKLNRAKNRARKKGA